MQQNQDMMQQWSGSAPYWEKHREILREMFAPVAQALIEDARINGRSTVLDVATGPGEPALTIAAALGPESKVVGTDLVPEMVEAARREAQRRGLRHASFEVSFAEDLPFADNTFDAVVSRFGVMYFPSPGDAIREWLRILKPAGKIALAVWHWERTNPFFHLISSAVVRQLGEVPPPEPDAPDAFRFAERGKLQAVLASAGVTEISERLLQFSIRARISLEDFWALRVEVSEKLRARVAAVSQQKKAELKADVVQALKPYSANGEIVLPAEVLIVSGQKNSA